MDYAFSNLLASPYRGGNIVLRDDTLLCAAGNRVREVELRGAASRTHAFEAPHQARRRRRPCLLLASGGLECPSRAAASIASPAALLHSWPGVSASRPVRGRWFLEREEAENRGRKRRGTSSSVGVHYGALRASARVRQCACARRSERRRSRRTAASCSRSTRRGACCSCCDTRACCCTF